MVTLKVVADTLDGWPTSQEDLKSATIECSGKAFFDLQRLAAIGNELEKLDLSQPNDEAEGETNNDGTSGDCGKDDLVKAIDLFSLSEKQLSKLNYYQVLRLPYKPNLTPDDVKKAYRKASLIYHPDKSGRGEEDAVFLKVKAAFETLSTQKQAYDSTEMPFDESVPNDDDVSKSDFFKAYGPAFERNLHFDARLLAGNGNGSGGGGGMNGGKKANKNNRRKSRNAQKPSSPPSLGDETTSIEQVHEFYDYWTHFTSWRDFSLQAARELETEEHLENAESRYEKRWYQKEIDRQAKKLKQQEQARITSLVERAMASDPRLIQERKRLIEEKEMKKKQREQEILDKKQREENERIAEETRIQEEKKIKAQEKLQREKEKKMMRKAKQGLRRVVAEALATLLEPEYALDDPVDEICAKLNRDQLLKLTARLESLSANAADVVQAVRKRAENLDSKMEEAENEAPNVNGSSSNNDTKQNVTVALPVSTKSTKVPFTKEELSTLAKGVKKYPPGGANRWDQIAMYINNVCRPETPRTKEECIELYNQNKTVKTLPTAPAAASAPVTAPAAAEPPTASDEDIWTEEQDNLLQEGLANNPGTMDKNERWTNIAKAVPGKTKKQCVTRFKAIRDAIKNKK